MTAIKSVSSDSLLSDRTRLNIMCLIASSDGPISFNEMIEVLEITKGNLSSHIQKLELGGFLKVEKAFIDRKPKTTYECTDLGRNSLKKYLEEIEQLILKVKSNTTKEKSK